MSTPVRIAANRANAQHSTGPRTDAGKLASSSNSLRHGLTAKKIVLPGENAADYEALRLEFHRDFAPANTAETTLVDQIAQHTWRLQRVRRAETAMFDKLMQNMETDLAIADAITDPEGELERIRRYEVTIERSYHRAIDQLRKLQKDRRAAEKDDAARRRERCFALGNGFVSQPPAKSADCAPDWVPFAESEIETGAAVGAALTVQAGAVGLNPAEAAR